MTGCSRFGSEVGRLALDPSMAYGGAVRSCGPLLLLACLLSAPGCRRPRNAEIRDDIERAATDFGSGTSTGIQLAICGFTPGHHVKLHVESLSLTLGRGDRGTGEMEAILTGDSGLRCEGKASFEYEPSPDKSSSQHWWVRAFARVGAPSPVVAIAKGRATKGALGVPVNATLTDDWPALPRTSAAALTYDIPRDGRYGFRLSTTQGPAAWFVAYQGDRPIQDPSGGITEIALVAGPVTILLLADEPLAVVLDARAVAPESEPPK
jgi:hypothetical protein